jgi:glyoxylase-like metal-dependent hydrolase (beta-lactamase superfamily II)
MKRGFVLGALVIVGGLSAALSATEPARQGPGQQPSASALQVDKINDNLYVLRGGGGNSAVFVSATGVILVDTKLPGWGKPILEKVKELTDKPVTTIINTHTHFDHVSGNVDFPPTVDIVTQENTARLMREMQPPAGYPDAPRKMFEDSKGVGLPKHTFKEEMTIGSGNDRVELHYFGRAHTGGDAFVVFPILRVMHAGDVFPIKGMPIMDANNGGGGIEYPATLGKAAGRRQLLEGARPVPGSGLRSAVFRRQRPKRLADAPERGIHLERAEIESNLNPATQYRRDAGARAENNESHPRGARYGDGVRPWRRITSAMASVRPIQYDDRHRPVQPIMRSRGRYTPFTGFSEIRRDPPSAAQ